LPVYQVYSSGQEKRISPKVTKNRQADHLRPILVDQKYLIPVRGWFFVIFGEGLSRLRQITFL
jgi:hypothetical protein